VATVERFAKFKLLILQIFLSGPEFASCLSGDHRRIPSVLAVLFSTQLSTGFAADIKLK